MNNKPEWGDIPEWVEYIAQWSEDGEWIGYYKKPDAGEEGYEVAIKDGITNGIWYSGTFGVISGDWRDTLEQRPNSFERMISKAMAVCNCREDDHNAKQIMIDLYKAGMLVNSED